MRFPSFLLLAWICTTTQAQARPQAQEVWISPDTYGDSRALLVAVKESMDAHPNAQRLHFNWGLASPHAGHEGVLIYDQTRQSLWIRQTNFSNVSDDEEAQHPIYQVSNLSQQWRFSRVTPNRLRLLFWRYGQIKPNQTVSDTAYQVSFFPRLKEFGCRGGLVARTSIHWRERYDGKRKQFVRVAK